MDRSKRFTLFALHDRPVHSDTNSASPGSILVMQQLRATTKSLTCPPLSIARYSFIQLSQQGRQWRERKCPIFDTVAKQDSNPGSLDCKSGILPLSYRAPHPKIKRSRELRVAATHARTRRLRNVRGWRTSFRRTIFFVQTKILYCGPTITHKVSFWRLK